MRVLAVLIVFMLGGCAASAVKENPERLDFVKVSEGEATGFIKAVRGGAQYCMTEVFQSKEGSYAIQGSYKDSKCTATWILNDGVQDPTSE